MTVTRKSKAGSGFNFTLVNTASIMNADWFQNAGIDVFDRPTPQEQNMKSTLHKGGVADLNVYSTGLSGYGLQALLGYACLPESYEQYPSNDGVVFLYSTVPGGTLEGYNYGKEFDSMPLLMKSAIGSDYTIHSKVAAANLGITLRIRLQKQALLKAALSGAIPAVSKKPTVHTDYCARDCRNRFTSGQFTKMAQQFNIYRSSGFQA